MNKAEIIAAVAQSTGQTQKVEEEFEVMFKDEEADHCATVGDIMDLVVLNGGV